LRAPRTRRSSDISQQVWGKTCRASPSALEEVLQWRQRDEDSRVAEQQRVQFLHQRRRRQLARHVSCLMDTVRIAGRALLHLLGQRNGDRQSATSTVRSMCQCLSVCLSVLCVSMCRACAKSMAHATSHKLRSMHLDPCASNSPPPAPCASAAAHAALCTPRSSLQNLSGPHICAGRFQGQIIRGFCAPKACLAIHSSLREACRTGRQPWLGEAPQAEQPSCDSNGDPLG
jgi:hypothetical protein